MKLLPRVLLFSVVASSALGTAEAQNNSNNLGNINGANAIEESSQGGENSANNVLNSEELNSSGNELSNADAEAIDKAENLYQQNNAGENNAIESNANGNPSNLNSEEAPPPANNGLVNGLGNSENNFTRNQGNKSNSSGANGTNAKLPVNPSLNPGNPAAGNFSASPNATPPANTTTPPTNAAPPPNAAAVPSSEDAPSAPANVAADPNAIPAEGASANAANAEEPTEADDPAPTLSDKKKARLDLARKIAESIPPLRPGEGPAEYTVQPGDTLWDITDQLLDDPMWWPKLWVLNPEVTDPHKIEPGMKLLFYPSEAASQVPEFAIRDSADLFGDPKIDMATLQTFSMQETRWTGKNGELIDPNAIPGDQHLLTVGEIGMNATYIFNIPGFLSYSEIDSAGEIVTNPNSPLIGGKGQSVFAVFNGRTPNPGERFAVLKHTSIISGMDSTKRDLELYNYAGVLGVVKSAPDGHTQLIAEDNSSYAGPTDILVPLSKPLIVAIDPFSSGRPNAAPAFVVATENGTYTHAGPGMAVFLQGVDGGNPFSVGDDVELFMPVGGNFGYSDEIGLRESVATARIVEANADTAVGVILRARREVSSGASTRADLAL